MKPLPIALLAGLVLAGCSQTSPPATASKASKPSLTAAQLQALQSNETLASYDGYGPVHFGMDDPTFLDAWKATLTGTDDPTGICSLIRPKWVHEIADFDFMFDHGQFVRYDIGTPKQTAPGGGKVGMTVAQIQALYGAQLELRPHKYLPGAQYLRLADGKGHVLLFETGTDGKVNRWRVGVPPQIDNEDGCE